jgi:hypothetical protein
VELLALVLGGRAEFLRGGFDRHSSLRVRRDPQATFLAETVDRRETFRDRMGSAKKYFGTRIRELQKAPVNCARRENLAVNARLNVPKLPGKTTSTVVL